MGLFSKTVNHNTLNHKAEQGGRAVLGTAKLKKTPVPKGKGTVKQPSAKQQQKARWS